MPPPPVGSKHLKRTRVVYPLQALDPAPGSSKEKRGGAAELPRAVVIPRLLVDTGGAAHSEAAAVLPGGDVMMVVPPDSLDSDSDSLYRGAHEINLKQPPLWGAL